MSHQRCIFFASLVLWLVFTLTGVMDQVSPVVAVSSFPTPVRDQTSRGATVLPIDPPSLFDVATPLRCLFFTVALAYAFILTDIVRELSGSEW